MLVYVVRRLVSAVVLLLVVTAATFAIFFLVPRLAGATPESLASRYVGRTADEATMRAIAEKLGFLDPVYVQYGRFLRQLVFGADFSTGPTTVHCPAPCLGYSFITQNPVLPDILDRLPVTMSLAAGAAVLWLTSGVAIGVLSLPIFFTGLLSLSIFSYGLGITAPGGSYTRIEDNPLLWAYDLLLPWITLAFLYSAAYARLTRAGMLDTMGEDFIRTARAKGLPERTVVVKHGLRAALTPILTLFGLDLGLLLGGAILTESTFSLPGIGKYSVDAVVNNDLPKVLGVVIVGSLFIIVANLVVDLLYAVVDPRVRTR
jgi:peptide/nickel transport system permease protein